MAKKAKDNSRALSTRIFIGLLAGIVVGVGLRYWGENPLRQQLLENLIQPIGSVFLRALFMTVVPLVFCSLVVSVQKLGDLKSIGKLGGRLMSFYLITTFIAVVIGMITVHLIQPGSAVSPEAVESTKTAFAGVVQDLQGKSEGAKSSLWPGILNQIVPRNVLYELSQQNMMATIFTSLVLAAALASMGMQRSKSVVDFFETISEAMVVLIKWIMVTAPIAVGALVANAVVLLGLEVIQSVALYTIAVLIGFVIHFTVTYGSILKFIVKMPISVFMKKMTPVFLTAFGTSSSNATIPTTISTLETEFNVQPHICRFSVPFGATINMDGTALFEAAAAVFIAQVFNVDLTMFEQIAMVVLVMITSVGVAGVPGGSIPLLMSVLVTFNIPAEGIALILGIDRLLDMSRTVVNVTGDSIAAIYLNQVDLARRKS